MSYELFQQGPAAYIPVILVSLVVTVVAYGAFPFIFARARKKVITKKKYNRLCYGFNILESVLKPSHCVKNDDLIEWEHEET